MTRFVPLRHVILTVAFVACSSSSNGGDEPSPAGPPTSGAAFRPRPTA
jgi:hypothetical protein